MRRIGHWNKKTLKEYFTIKAIRSKLTGTRKITVSDVEVATERSRRV